MIPRLLATAALVAVTLAACSDTRGNDMAAEVESASVSRDEFEALLQSFAANSEITGLIEDLDTGTVDANGARQWLSLLVIDAAREALLADAGESITDADREAVLAQVSPDDPVLQFPDDIVSLLVDQQASGAALGRVAAASADAREQYEAAPAELGVLCVRHILVETEEEAQAVLEELDAGADFAELAAERSTEPAAAETGGAIELAPGQPCIPLEQAQASLDAAFVEGAVAAVPGTPTEPVETPFGWHIILARPYDEVAEAVNAAVGQQLFQEHLATVDVAVDPRYGRWDPAAGAVVPL